MFLPASWGRSSKRRTTTISHVISTPAITWQSSSSHWRSTVHWHLCLLVDRCHSHLSSINISPIHVLHGILCLIRKHKLDVTKPSTEVRMKTIDRKVDCLYFPIIAEYFHDMILCYISGESPDMDSRWFRCFRAFKALST